MVQQYDNMDKLHHNTAHLVHRGSAIDIEMERDNTEYEYIKRLAEEERIADEQREALIKITSIEYLTLYPAKIVAFCMSLGLALLLWIALFVRVGLDGVPTYIQYFTNWMFTFNVIFYTGDVISYLDWTGNLQHYWIAFIWWPFFANVAQVFWLVFILLIQNPDLLMQSAEEYGLGLTLGVERFIHVIPFVFCLLWGILRLRDIVHVMSRFPWVDGYKGLYFVYLVYNFFIANSFLFCYWANYDFYEIYGVSIYPAAGILLIEIIYLVHNTVAILIFSPICRHVRDAAYEDIQRVRIVELV